MRKTSVYLSEEESARLARLAARDGTSQAQIIRRAIDTYEPPLKPARALALSAVADGPGESVADLDEDALLDGFGA